MAAAPAREDRGQDRGAARGARLQRKKSKSNEESKTESRRRRAVAGFRAALARDPADCGAERPGWIHEIKFDGYRIQARLDHGKVRLLTRKGLDWTQQISQRGRRGRRAAAPRPR